VKHIKAPDRVDHDSTPSFRTTVRRMFSGGPGIPPQMRKRIFDLFVTTRPEGTGLGLFLARTAIQRCNGTIEALAREGGGTCFRITLRKATTS
jgi:signal transduction histidine kinase